jgi:hypothetical protein
MYTEVPLQVNVSYIVASGASAQVAFPLPAA